MVKHFLSLHIFLFVGFCASADPLAADSLAAKYRTGIIDPLVEQIPAHIENSVFESPQENLPALVEFLTEGTNDPYLKVKRLHDWITNHIAYDSDLFMGLSSDGTREPNEILLKKRTTCGGFTRLFTEMATMAGLEARGVSGKSRGYVTADGPSGHAWNQVKINEKWYIVDVTAGNRHGFYQGKFSEKRKYQDHSLFIHPDIKILINYPNNEEYKFSNRFATLQEFLDAPQISIHGLKYDVTYENDFFAQIKKESFKLKGGVQYLLRDVLFCQGETVKMYCRTPPNVRISASLSDLDVSRFDEFGDDNEVPEIKKYPNHIHTRIVNGLYEIAISPPASGRYQVHINARFTDRTGNFQAIYSFVLSNSGDGGELLPVKNELSKYHYFYEHDVEILDDNICCAAEEGFYYLKVKIPDGVSIVSNLRNFENTILRDNYYKSESGNIQEFYYKIPETGDYLIRAFTRSERDSSSQNCFDLRIDTKTNGSRVFPPPNRVFHRKAFADYGFEVVGSNVESINDVYYITHQCPPGYTLSGGLYDLEKNRFPDNYILDIEGDLYTFYFTQPEVNVAVARIFMVDTAKKSSVVTEFFLNNPEAGEKLPGYGKIYRNRIFADKGMQILSENIVVDDGQSFYKMVVDKGNAFALHAAAFDMNNERIADNVSYSSQGNIYTFFYTNSQKTNPWHVRIYDVSESGSMNTAATFKLRYDERKTARLPLPGLLTITNLFHKDGFQIVEQNIDSSKEYFEIVVKSPKDFTLKASLRVDDGGGHTKDLEVTEKGNVYTIRFKNTEGRTLRLFKATLENKMYLIGVLRL